MLNTIQWKHCRNFIIKCHAPLHRNLFCFFSTKLCLAINELMTFDFINEILEFLLVSHLHNNAAKKGEERLRTHKTKNKLPALQYGTEK